MDQIKLKGIVGYGYHGVLQEERSLGQRFVADVELSLDLSEPGRSDNLSEGIDYSKVYDCVLALLEGEPVQTLEHLVTRINEILLELFPPLQEVTTTVYKPGAAVRGPIEYVSVRRTAVRK